MIEKLAQRMSLVAWPNSAWESDFSDREKSEYRQLARACLEALREPSAAMTVAGWKKADERDAILGNGEIRMIWQSMIDVALLEDR